MPDPSQQSNHNYNNSNITPQEDSASMPNLSFDTGSSAPPPNFPDITDEPKKIYGGNRKGKIVATILGILALIGSVSAGAYLALNNQNPNEKAANSGGCADNLDSKSCGNACHSDGKSACVWRNNECKVSAQACGGGGGTEPAPDEVACPVGSSGIHLPDAAGPTYSYCGTPANKCVRDDLLASGGCNGYLSSKYGVPIQYGGVKCSYQPVYPKGCGVNTNVDPYDDGSCGGQTVYFDKTGYCNHVTGPTQDGLCATFPGCLGITPLATPTTGPTQLLEYSCDSKGCSVKTGSYPACSVIKYTCTGTAQISGCSQNPQGPAQSYTFDTNLCGKTQQIDVICQGVSKNFVTNVYPACVVTPKPPVITPPPTPSPSPTPMPVAQCQNVTAYSTTWTVLTATQLSQKKAGDVVNFCVVGSASAGIFDKAVFNINNVAMAETTVKRPNSQDFCQSYTIPTGTYAFKVKAQIHHVSLGWK